MKTLWISDKKEIEEIILKSEICFVGMVDKENMPYVIPMNFGYKDSIIYLHSGNEEGKKLICLEHNNTVSIAFCEINRLAYVNEEVACSYTMKSKSIVATCKVSFIEDLEEKGKALDIFMSHYSDNHFKYSVPALTNVKVWKAHIMDITCKEFGAPHK